MIGSFVAGTVGTRAADAAGAALVNAALMLRAARIFRADVPGARLRRSLWPAEAREGALAVSIGLFIAMIGIDLQTGVSRFTFGMPHLAGGIGVVVAAIGLFAIGEVLWMASQPATPAHSTRPKSAA